MLLRKPARSWPSDTSTGSVFVATALVTRASKASMAESYSLWIKPSGKVAEKLSQEIASQAAEYSAPVFEPHVTLLGDIQGNAEEIMQQSRELAGLIKKFRINFLDVSKGSSFHRCVYILVAKESAIMEAGKLARQQFNMDNVEYMPHASLLYADITPEQRTASQQQAVQRLYGEGSNYSTLLSDNGFTAETIALWYTPAEDKTLASWKQVAEFPLT